MIKVVIYHAPVPPTPPSVVNISMSLEEATHLKRVLNSTQLDGKRIERDGKGSHTLTDATRAFKNTLWNDLAALDIKMAVSATGVRE